MKYPAWTFDDNVPGPVIRGRVGDWLEVRYMNDDNTGNGHNIDFHCVLGPGGGAPATYAEAGEGKSGLFKMTYPGVYVYHCAAAPLPAHVGNGMYGRFLLSPLLLSPQPLSSHVEGGTGDDSAALLTFFAAL